MKLGLSLGLAVAALSFVACGSPVSSSVSGGTSGEVDAAAGRATGGRTGGAGEQGGSTTAVPRVDAGVHDGEAALDTVGAEAGEAGVVDAGDGGVAPGPDAATADGRPSEGADASAPSTSPRRVLVCDEGNRKVTLLELQGTARAIWSTSLNDPTKDGDGMRDLQLVGGGRVAVSTAKGYVELDLETGVRKKQVSSFSGVESLRRLPDGHTVLGSNANGGVTLEELDAQDVSVPGRKVTFTGYSQFRMLRRTPDGTFLIGVGNKLAEVTWDKKTVWEMELPAVAGHDVTYVYQGLRLPDGTLAVSTGYAASIALVDPKAKTVKQTLGGKAQPEAASIVPNFYAGFQILADGTFVVTNWEGHGAGNGNTGIQLLAYDRRGALVWKWKQSSTLVSSLHHVIVLDGLDTAKLHDDVNGVLAPVTSSATP